MAISGRHVLLYGNAGTKSAPRWVVIAEQENLTINASRSTQTVSHKDSNTDVVISGNKSITLDLTGFLLNSDEGIELMRRAFDSDQEMMLRVRQFGNDVEEYIVKVTNFTRAYPVGGAMTYNATFVPSQDVVRLA